jgi:1-deoxy-D-xylulose-5-phosphate reductoisomerase
MTSTITLLGSTGSIGRQTLEVAHELGLSVAALTANSSVDLIERQAREFSPRLAVLYDEASAKELKTRLSDTKTEVMSGMDGLLAAATLSDADTVVTAVVGMIGLKPTLAAVEKKKRIALANKETLVCAGELVMDAVERCGAELVPVDSEHSAIFQCLQGCRDRGEIRRLLLTCSGGPFYGLSFDELAGKTRDDALRHPNWTMGAKITIDSATLMNKGLEIIEAMRLYRLPLSQVEAVIHRQSIVHSLVEFRDGALLAQLGTPDMKLPIRYAMTYPCRAESPAEPLDLLSCPPLSFAKPDEKAFRCLALAKECARRGGTSCAVMNGANEVAVGAFLEGRIGFNDIPALVERALCETAQMSAPTLDDILEADRLARQSVLKEMRNINK